MLSMQERLAEKRAALRPPVFVVEDTPLTQWQMTQLGFQPIYSDLLPKNHVIVCPDDYPIAAPPISHEGSDSDARYHVDNHFDTLPNGEVVLVFISELHEKKHTSSHSHPGAEPNAEHVVFEHYYPLHGTVQLNGEPIPKEGITILPGQQHQGTTEEGEQGLILIAMEGAETLPYDKLHIPTTR